MNQKPIITIVVPVYNVEKEIDRCIHSLVAQTLQDIEIILVDDGSTDASGLICDKWMARDDRISVVHKANGGLSSARNAGIEIAEGHYIGFVDSDDYVDPRMYQALLEGFSDESISICCCGRYVHHDGIIDEQYSLQEPRSFTRYEAAKEVLLNGAIDVAAWDKLYKRELFRRIRYPEGRISEDAAVILPLLSSSNMIRHIGTSYYHYCYRDCSISKASYSHKKYDVVRNCCEMKGEIADYDPTLSTYVQSWCCSEMASLIESMLLTPGARSRWASDYKEYWKLFSENFMSYIEVGPHPKKEFIRVLLTRLHGYRLFWVIRQLRNWVRKHVSKRR